LLYLILLWSLIIFKEGFIWVGLHDYREPAKQKDWQEDKQATKSLVKLIRGLYQPLSGRPGIKGGRIN
jgi:hypothetical protein